MITITDPDHI